MERKLVTIVAADIAGFSRLVGDDEEATLTALHNHRSDFLDSLIKKHGGRIANTAGDSLLIEFGSAVKATRCAIALQEGMVKRNSPVPESRQIHFRIGINLGDVVQNDGDLLGDGVNVAARLESMAPPSGIIVSRSVRDQIRDRIDLTLSDLGEVKVKNITRPVRAFQILRPGEKPVAVPTYNTLPRFLLAVSGAAIIVAIFGLSWFLQRPDFTPVDPAEMTLELPAKPSIVVLPFRLSGEASSRDWIADGITDSIISTLSLAPDVIVIARSTAFSYKGRNIDAAQIAQELGVRYLLSGTVQNVGDKIRITTELADAVEGNQIWSFQEDSTADNLFDLQDNISRRVFEELSVSLTDGNSARHWIKLAGGFDNYVTFINGRAEFQKFSHEGNANAERIFGSLLRNEPDQAFATYQMGWIHWQKIAIGISADPAADMAEAKRLVKRALEIKEFGEGYTLAGVLALDSKQYDQAIAMADKAISLSPSSADANALGGWIKAASGQTQQGLEHMELGMRLEPDYPEWIPAAVNFARLELGRLDEAKSLAQEVLAADVKDVRAKPFAAGMLTAVAVFQGDLGEGRKQAKNFLKISPNASASHARRARRLYMNQEFVEKYIDALVRAGIPNN